MQPAALIVMLVALAGPGHAQAGQPDRQAPRTPTATIQAIVDNLTESAKGARLAAFKLQFAVNSMASVTGDVQTAAQRAHYHKGELDRFIQQCNDSLDTINQLLDMAEGFLGGRSHGASSGHGTGPSGALEPTRPTAGPGDAR